VKTVMTFCFLGMIASVACLAAEGPDILESYQVVYQQDFASAAALEDFQFSDPNVWWLGKTADGTAYLEQFGPSKYKYEVRSPYNIAILTKKKVRDFVLDLEVQQTGKEYGHRDVCIFFGFQDRSHFYYAHVASKTDDHAHNIFIVDAEPRTKISHKTTKGHAWTEDWHHLRVVRRWDGGSIEIYVDDMTTPIMAAENRSFQWGYVGFGTFDDTGRVRLITLRAPEAQPGETDRKWFASG
jgi:hypothetical protein